MFMMISIWRSNKGQRPLTAQGVLEALLVGVHVPAQFGVVQGANGEVTQYVHLWAGTGPQKMGGQLYTLHRNQIHTTQQYTMDDEELRWGAQRIGPPTSRAH